MSTTISDRFGRTWTVSGDVYSIDIPDDGQGNGTPFVATVVNSDPQRALDTINSMAPANWSEQP